MKKSTLIGSLIGLAVAAATIYGITYAGGLGWKNSQK